MRVLISLCLLLSTTTLWASTASFPADTSKPKLNRMMADQPMNNQRMGEILREVSTTVEGQLGNWRAQYYNRYLMVITDAANNRMRIISPIVKVEEIKKNQYQEILSAQFHKALDVKYALFDGVLWSVYAHPLKELTNEQFKDALSQVFFAAHNFGESYKSTDLQFGSGDD